LIFVDIFSNWLSYAPCKLVTPTLPYGVANVVEYLDAKGRSPFGRWFDRLPAMAAAKVNTARHRMTQGNLGDVKPVGEGVSERIIDWGPGYRIYFGMDGADLVVLLGGSGKKDQQEMIARSKERWRDYRRRKAKE
jgi:putative addiction module killer protein